MNNFNIKNIFFQGKNINVDGIETITKDNIKTHIIQCHTLKYDNSIACPNCGVIDKHKIKDYYLRTIKHSNLINNEECILQYKQRRYKCYHCNKSFNENLDIVIKGARLSNDLKQNIINDCNKGRTIVDVSETNHISETTVNKTISDNVTVERLPLTKIVCIDEFTAPVLDGKLAFIIVDPLSSSILDILPSRKQPYLYHYFSNIKSEELDSVEYIVSDLCPVYVNVIKDMFPKACHIVDRFHWLRLIINAVQEVRIHTMNFYKTLAIKETDNARNRQIALRSNEKYILYKVMKKNYKLLSFNTFDGDQSIMNVSIHMYGSKTKKTNREILEYMLNNDADLTEAYELLQELYRIAYTSTFDNARERIQNWINKVNNSERFIAPLKKETNTIIEWRKQILNSFIISEELGGFITNGVIEAKNNTCKTIIKTCYGLTNFKNFRARVMLAEKERRLRNEQSRKKRYINRLNKLKKNI